VTVVIAPVPPNPVVRSMPVTLVWRAYPAGLDVQAVALPAVVVFSAGFGDRLTRAPPTAVIVGASG
jgi:hypothetical protein